LSLDEEAALAFAAAGITGHALGELPYRAGRDPESGCGNILVHLVGRTVPSGDALHTAILFVSNDEGTWMVKRPQDFSTDELRAVVAAGREGRLTDAYRLSRVQLSDRRVSTPRKVPVVAPFNLWDSNLPGTTYFLPVSDITPLYINVLLTAFSEELGYYIVDDHAGYRSAGLGRFRRSKGGHLYDDVEAGRALTVGYLETALATIASAEEGAMQQNMALMAEALGLGGFTHACRHPEWLKTLGFKMTAIPFSRAVHLPWYARATMRMFGLPDPDVELPVGLARSGRSLVRPYCPPNFPDMKSAVKAYLDYKFRTGRNTLHGNGPSPWRDSGSVRKAVPQYSERAIDATIAYCQYLVDRYGRFPATISAFENGLAYQAHHLDVGFYDRFYDDQALGHRQRTHGHS
jgi:hypothetical protein